MRKIIGFSIGLIAGLGVIVGGALGYIHFRIDKEAKRFEKDIRQFKKNIETYFVYERDGVKLSIDGDIGCEKEGWFKPNVVCKASELVFKFQTQKEMIEPFSFRDLKVDLEPSIQMLLGNEVAIKASGKYEIGQTLVKKMIEEMSSQREAMVAKNILSSWLPNKFDVSFKANAENDKTFITVTDLKMMSDVLNYEIFSKEQNQVVQDNRISLFDFLNQYYLSPDNKVTHYTPLVLNLTISQGSRTKEEVEYFIRQLAHDEPMLRQMTPEGLANFANLGLEMLSGECGEKCSQISYFEEYIQYAKNIVSILASQKDSSTLSLTLKKDADIQSKAFRNFREMLQDREKGGIDGASLGEIFLDLLKEYNVSVE